MYKSVSALAFAAVLCACSEPESVVVTEDDAQSAFETEDERTIYALGTALGESVGESVTGFALSEAEQELMIEGIRDVLRDESPQVDMDVYGPLIQGLLDRRIAAESETEKTASAAFADEIAAEEGAERFPSGLIVVPMEEGDGEMPAATDTVRVHYHGMLRDGTVFDSSVDRGEPTSFPLNGVIPCWTEGVQLIRVGGKAKLLCPSDIAYGDAGRPPVIPGGAALLFEVELLEIL
jgi:FKBP-type peptidyl-prolyl cis-trans isomerase FkpA